MKTHQERRGFLTAFKIPQNKMRMYEKNFMKLFQKYLDNENYSVDELHHIIIAVDQANLEKWVTVLTKRRIDSEAKKASENGWFGGFFKQKKIEEEKTTETDISTEEIDELYKQLYDKFLANDEADEIDSVTPTKNISVELLIKNGGLNLEDHKTKIQLYFDD